MRRFLALALLLPSVSNAHRFDPGVLQLSELPDGKTRVAWKPPLDEAGEPLMQTPALPIRCSPRVPDPFGKGASAWVSECGPDWLRGAAFSLGESSAAQEVLVRVVPLQGEPWVGAVNPGATLNIPTTVGREPPPPSGFILGLTHVISGLDHLAFLFCLALLVTGRALVWAVTAFTAGHMLTVTTTALGWVNAPPLAMEVLIALSVVGLAAELARPKTRRSFVLSTAPWVAAFAFGLIHGFGFAGALVELGLSSRQLWKTLLFFNLGVEAGQLLVVIPIGVGAWFLARRWAPAWLVRVPAYVLGSVAMFWTLQRVMLLWV